MNDNLDINFFSFQLANTVAHQIMNIGFVNDAGCFEIITYCWTLFNHIGSFLLNLNLFLITVSAFLFFRGFYATWNLTAEK